MLAAKEHRRITDTSCDSKQAMDASIAAEMFLGKLFAKCLIEGFVAQRAEAMERDLKFTA